MAANNSTQPELINGCYPISSMDLQHIGMVLYDQAQSFGVMFRSIARLTDDKEIIGLCSHGNMQADIQANEIDELNERASKAGFQIA